MVGGGGVGSAGLTKGVWRRIQPAVINTAKGMARSSPRTRNFTFIVHYGQGTCSRYGYGLGPSVLLDRLLSRLGLFAQ